MLEFFDEIGAFSSYYVYGREISGSELRFSSSVYVAEFDKSKAVCHIFTCTPRNFPVPNYTTDRCCVPGG